MEIPIPRSSSPRKALFVTFYSFKGGVGRTMALLNTAAILSRLGRRVLMVDFDLEAPGLTLFQDRQRGEGAARKQLGLVDALADFLDTPETAPLADADPDRFLSTYVTTLDIPEGGRGTIEGGQLDLLPTGRLDGNYGGRMHGLSFDDLFEGGVGVPMFEHLKGLIRDSDRYDYVLIDSRTGFSDEGSICTRYLADALIVVTGLNHQNLRGTAGFLTQAGIGTVGPKRIAFVASPVPVFYEELVAERRREAEQVLEDAGLSEARFVAEIPYHPLLALDESPWDRDLSQTLLYGAYEKIEDTLRTWAGDRPQERFNQAVEMLRQGQEIQALDLIQAVRKEDAQLVLRMLPSVATSFTEQKLSRIIPVLEEWLDLAREIGEPENVMRALTGLGRASYENTHAENAINYHEEALSLSRELGDRRMESINLASLASSVSDLGRLNEAISYDEKALSIVREVGDRQGEGILLGNFGSRMADLGRLDEAVSYQNEALSIVREVGDRRSEGIVLGNLGSWMADLGRLDEAVSYQNEALSIVREVGDRQGEGILLGNRGIALAKLGRDGALDSISQARRIVDDLDAPFLRARFVIKELEVRAALNPTLALSFADDVWETVTNNANAFERARAQVLRARLRAAHGDPEGAATDAQAALDLYRPNSVDSRWSREAEAILREVQATTP